MDPDALDAAIVAHSSNQWYARGCAVGRMIADLPPGEYRTKLTGYINAPVHEVGHAPIIGAIKSTLGVQIRGDALLRHRRHSCACPDEVYA